MSEMAYANPAGRPHPQHQLMARLEEELSQLQVNLEALTGDLGPILQPETEDAMNVPEEAPYNDLHNSILRLGRLNSRLGHIRSRIHL